MNEWFPRKAREANKQWSRPLAFRGISAYGALQEEDSSQTQGDEFHLSELRAPGACLLWTKRGEGAKPPLQSHPSQLTGELSSTSERARTPLYRVLAFHKPLDKKFPDLRSPVTS